MSQRSSIVLVLFECSFKLGLPSSSAQHLYGVFISGTIFGWQRQKSQLFVVQQSRPPRLTLSSHQQRLCGEAFERPNDVR